MHALLKFECFAFCLNISFLGFLECLIGLWENWWLPCSKNLDLVDLRSGKLVVLRSSLCILDLLFKGFSNDQLSLLYSWSFLDSYETYVSMNQNHISPQVFLKHSRIFYHHLATWFLNGRFLSNFLSPFCWKTTFYFQPWLSCSNVLYLYDTIW